MTLPPFFSILYIYLPFGSQGGQLCLILPLLVRAILVLYNSSLNILLVFPSLSGVNNFSNILSPSPLFNLGLFFSSSFFSFSSVSSMISYLMN